MKETTIFGDEIEGSCIACEIVNDIDKFKEGRIFKTEFFDIHQDYGIAVPGLMVIAANRHVTNIDTLTDDELAEISLLQVYCKKALLDLWECEDVAYLLFEKPASHLHYIVIPMWKSLKINNKYAVLAELAARADELKSDAENMKKVREAVVALRKWFNERLGQ